MDKLCFNKLVLWIFMESHEMERRKSFVFNKQGEEKKSVGDWKKIWLEVKKE